MTDLLTTYCSGCYLFFIASMIWAWKDGSLEWWDWHTLIFAPLLPIALLVAIILDIRHRRLCKEDKSSGNNMRFWDA